MTRAIEGAKDGSVEVRKIFDYEEMEAASDFHLNLTKANGKRGQGFRVTPLQLAALRAAYPKKFKEM